MFTFAPYSFIVASVANISCFLVCSVRRAKIATQDKYIEDVFYVVDTESQKPLQASQFDTFKEKLFKRIADRKRMAHVS